MAKEFVPLVAGSNEYTPATDTDFSNGDVLMAYFELYEPTIGQPAAGVACELHHADPGMSRMGQRFLKKVENADSWVQPGKPAIPIAVEVELSQLNLAPGKYRLEIQGTDSAGRSTPLRTAHYWIN